MLVAERGVVFFRDQELDIDQQLQLGCYYGPLHVHQNLGHPKGYPESDVSNEHQPPSYTSFKVLTNPPVGGDTLWASGYEAYERLTPLFREVHRRADGCSQQQGPSGALRRKGNKEGLRRRGGRGGQGRHLVPGCTGILPAWPSTSAIASSASSKWACRWRRGILQDAQGKADPDRSFSLFHT
ncbi:hypothetical protein PF007_g18689 [Phytophthora fragariae]|uniref:TauD/TfdA-like domain-containing protein n=2 Tax=Phytophthora fragariae TaxID=53985 RepID=A0A6A3ED93_9STRA|nr:hypothetical protein PF003_g25219 [Phytophthora fragariae]KAE8930533.1 hypothetical protein PF009_g19379 [Phytophthora fragariae]KAE9091978.1 hypothetical protein PF007_g18689 [Phytophthora fragariae]